MPEDTKRSQVAGAGRPQFPCGEASPQHRPCACRFGTGAIVDWGKWCAFVTPTNGRRVGNAANVPPPSRSVVDPLVSSEPCRASGPWHRGAPGSRATVWSPGPWCHEKKQHGDSERRIDTAECIRKVPARLKSTEASWSAETASTPGAPSRMACRMMTPRMRRVRPQATSPQRPSRVRGSATSQ